MCATDSGERDLIRDKTSDRFQENFYIRFGEDLRKLQEEYSNFQELCGKESSHVERSVSLKAKLNLLIKKFSLGAGGEQNILEKWNREYCHIFDVKDTRNELEFEKWFNKNRNTRKMLEALYTRNHHNWYKNNCQNEEKEKHEALFRHKASRVLDSVVTEAWKGCMTLRIESYTRERLKNLELDHIRELMELKIAENRTNQKNLSCFVVDAISEHPLLEVAWKDSEGIDGKIDKLTISGPGELFGETKEKVENYVLSPNTKIPIHFTRTDPDADFRITVRSQKDNSRGTGDYCRVLVPSIPSLTPIEDDVPEETELNEKENHVQDSKAIIQVWNKTNSALVQVIDDKNTRSCRVENNPKAKGTSVVGVYINRRDVRSSVENLLSSGQEISAGKFLPLPIEGEGLNRISRIQGGDQTCCYNVRIDFKNGNTRESKEWLCQNEGKQIQLGILLNINQTEEGMRVLLKKKAIKDPPIGLESTCSRETMCE